MRKLPLVALGALAASIVGALALRRIAIREDLDWESVERPGALVDVGGYMVHCVDRGAGPAVVLVHGFGGHTYSYRHLLPALARDHRVVAVDLKGFGYSQRVTAGLAQADQARMLKGLLERLGIERAVFVGHSMGGGVVQRLAVMHPDVVEALVLVASVGGDERQVHTLPLPPALVRPLMPVLAGVAASQILRLAFHDPSLVTREVREQYLRPVRIRGSMDGLLAMMRERAADPLDASPITQPVLLLWGAEDRVVPLATAQRIRERIPHARLVVVAGAAHLVLEERPDECYDAIAGFLREARLARPAAPAAP